MEQPKKKSRNALSAAAAAAAMMAISPSSDASAKEPDFKGGRIGEFSKPVFAPKPERLVAGSIDISSNVLSTEEIKTQRDEAIRSLLEGLPQDAQLDHLRDPERLQAESQAYAPSDSERQRVFERSRNELIQLANAIPQNEHGVFAFADIGSGGNEERRVYIMHKQPSGVVQFVKAYRVSMAEKGFGNRKDSGQTPLGLRFFLSKHEGMYGEVVTAEKGVLPLFNRSVRDSRGIEHKFVSDFGDYPFIEPASVITDRYTIDEQRGIHFHGSNRTGSWKLKNGSKHWESYLSQRGTGACIRMANADVRDMGRRYIKMPMRRNGVVISNGTPVFIHATPEVLRKHSQIR